MGGVVARLDVDLLRSPRLLFDDESRIAVMSDFHIGIGDYADDFLHNAGIALEALNHYLQQGFTLILAGDIEELWENCNPHAVIAAHLPLYTRLRTFHREGRLYKLHGNHDEMWRNPAMVRRYLWYIPTRYGHEPLLKGLNVHAGLLLVHRRSGHSLFVTHGHQGDPRIFYPPARFFVRHLWRFLQQYGFQDPTSPARNHHRRIILEERIARWVRLRHQPVLAGHTHHPLFPPEGDVPYYNIGSGIHPYSITAVEIVEGAMSLVKWSSATPNGHGPIYREVMAGPRPFDRV